MGGDSLSAQDRYSCNFLRILAGCARFAMSAPRSYEIPLNCMGPQNEAIQHLSTVFLCGVICSLGEEIAIVDPGSVWLGLSRAVAVLRKDPMKIRVAACGITVTQKAQKVLNHTRLFAKLNRLRKTTTSGVCKLRLPPLHLSFLQYCGEFTGGGFVHVIRHLLVAHEDELELCTPCES